MMKYGDSAELEDKSSCAGVRADLKMCLLESDCCKIVSFYQSNIFNPFYYTTLFQTFMSCGYVYEKLY